jgi:hypothetical protein
MRPTLQSVAVTIVDVLGVFLAGAVWLVLGWAVCRRLAFMPAAVGSLPGLLGIDCAPNTSPSGFGYAAFVAMAFIVGYVANTFCVGAAEYLAFPSRWIKCWRTKHAFPAEKRVIRFTKMVCGCLVSRGLKLYFKESLPHPAAAPCESCPFSYPYDDVHRDKPYFHTLATLIAEATDLESMALPATQPVSGCRRLLKMATPPLWAEVERYEAEVRLLASLFVASMVVLLANFRPSSRVVQWRGSWHWPFLIVVVLLLGIAFHKARRREVRYVYLNALLAKRSIRAMLGNPKITPSSTAAGG